MERCSDVNRHPFAVRAMKLHNGTRGRGLKFAEGWKVSVFFVVVRRNGHPVIRLGYTCDVVNRPIEVHADGRRMHCLASSEQDDAYCADSREPGSNVSHGATIPPPVAVVERHRQIVTHRATPDDRRPPKSIVYGEVQALGLEGLPETLTATTNRQTISASRCWALGSA